jgi:hypothetical protein
MVGIVLSVFSSLPLGTLDDGLTCILCRYQKILTELLWSLRWNALSSHGGLLGNFRLLFVATNLVAFTSSLENLVKVIFAPPDVRVEASKLPHTVNFLVPVLIGAMGMTLHENRGHRLVGVPLVGHTQLMPPDDLVIRHLLPLRSTTEVLCLQGLVPEDSRIRSHRNKIFRWHGFPYLVEERAVVDAQGRCNDLA